jgi:hypothetical protein
MRFRVHGVCSSLGWSKMDWFMGDGFVMDLHNGDNLHRDCLTSIRCLLGILP